MTGITIDHRDHGIPDEYWGFGSIIIYDGSFYILGRKNCNLEVSFNMAIITFLIIGWILNWFKFERLFIQAFKELFGKDITKATYYFLFLCVGVLGEIVLLFQGAYYEYFLHR